MLSFLIFLETVKAEEEDQVDPQVQKNPHDSSTDSCLIFPYRSNSPRPFPPSPVHSVTDSPKRVSPLPIATSNPPSDNAVIHSPIVHNLPTPAIKITSYPSLESLNEEPKNELTKTDYEYYDKKRKILIEKMAIANDVYLAHLQNYDQKDPKDRSQKFLYQFNEVGDRLHKQFDIVVE